MVGHSTGSGLWITFRNTQVVYFCSGQWWDFTPALTEFWFPGYIGHNCYLIPVLLGKEKYASMYDEFHQKEFDK